MYNATAKYFEKSYKICVWTNLKISTSMHWKLLTQIARGLQNRITPGYSRSQWYIALNEEIFPQTRQIVGKVSNWKRWIENTNSILYTFSNNLQTYTECQRSACLDIFFYYLINIIKRKRIKQKSKLRNSWIFVFNFEISSFILAVLHTMIQQQKSIKLHTISRERSRNSKCKSRYYTRNIPF